LPGAYRVGHTYCFAYCQDIYGDTTVSRYGIVIVVVAAAAAAAILNLNKNLPRLKQHIFATATATAAGIIELN